MIVKIRKATESTMIKSHTTAVARLAPVTARPLSLALPRPDVEVARDAQDEQPVEGVQAAMDRVIVGEPGEHALQQRRQHHQHGRPGDRAGPQPRHTLGEVEPATAKSPDEVRSDCNSPTRRSKQDRTISSKVASHQRELVLAPLSGCARPVLRGCSRVTCCRHHTKDTALDWAESR